mmetsp:Transcript_15939/g.28943  ORF Transcript_15939/g.28943 Transcript_15939/m.28943 type:complete len:350 (-) Transcript_15939:847-1896(-)
MNASPPPPLVFDSVVAAAAVVVVVVVVPKFRPPRSYVLRWPTEAWRQPSPSRQTQRMQPLALAMVQIGPVPCRRPPSISPFFAPTPNRPGIAYWLGTRLALRCLPQSASAAPTSLTSSLRLASHRFDDPRELSGRDIVVQWAKGKRYEGRITNYDRDTGQHYVEYADGEKKWYDMTTKTFWMYSSCRRFWHKYEPPRGQQEATVATARVTETRVNERRERGLTPIRSFVVDGVELVEDDPVDILFSSDVFSDGDDQWHVGQVKRCRITRPMRTRTRTRTQIRPPISVPTLTPVPAPPPLPSSDPHPNRHAHVTVLRLRHHHHHCHHDRPPCHLCHLPLIRSWRERKTVE